MKNCSTCHSTYPDDYTHCPRDGTALRVLELWTEGAVIRDKYRILGQIGSGGMAAVYKAQHVHFRELRALKVIGADLARDAKFVQRFMQEAVLTRRLQHPNAVRVDDIDKAEDGRPFMVMEYIEGRSLKEVILKESPLPVERACRIARQVAQALDAAHQLHMVHRDIKPANIVLIQVPRGEEAKVLDFGIAKAKEAGTDSQATAQFTLTGAGMVVGTPAYMSPEQAKGKRGEEVDGRSDLYSLGVVLYQMLTGDLPLKADSELQLMMAHIGTQPVPILTRRPDLPEPIAALVMKCLEKNPDDRPASAGAMVQEIERWELERAQSAPTATRAEPPAADRTVVDLAAAAQIEEQRKAEKERLAREQAEKEQKLREEASRLLRLAEEKSEQERLAREQAGKERELREEASRLLRLAEEKAEQERRAREEAERKGQVALELERQKAEQERLDRENAEAKRRAEEQAAQEQRWREQAEQQRRESGAAARRGAEAAAAVPKPVVAPRPSPSSKGKIAAIAGVAAVAVLATAGYLFWQHSKGGGGASPTPPAASGPPNPAPAGKESAAPGHVTPSGGETPAAPAGSASPETTSGGPAASTGGTPKPPPKPPPPGVRSAKTASSGPAGAAPVHSETVAAKPAPSPSTAPPSTAPAKPALPSNQPSAPSANPSGSQGAGAYGAGGEVSALGTPPAGSLQDHVNKGSRYLNQGQVDLAIKEFQTAIQINPNDAGAHTGLGAVWVRQYKWDQAIAEESRAIQINPGDPYAHLNLASALAGKGEVDQALREINTALRLAPALPGAKDIRDYIEQLKKNSAK